MRWSVIIAAVIAVYSVGEAKAATVGSFDGSQVFSRAVFTTGDRRDAVRDATTASGHMIAAATGTLSAGYLSGVDVFYTSAMGLGSDSRALDAGEQAALVDWVNRGGVLFSTGETSSLAPIYRSVLNPFAIDIVGQAGQGSNSFWVNDPSIDLLAGGVAGQALNDVGTALVGSAGATTLALNNGMTVGLLQSFGAGFIVAIGDSNFLDDNRINPADRQFFLNVLESAPGVQAVPLPLAAPMLALAVGLLAAAGRKRHSS